MNLAGGTGCEVRMREGLGFDELPATPGSGNNSATTRNPKPLFRYSAGLTDL